MTQRICLAISAFRSDEAVLRLLEHAVAFENPPWSHILVVDSLGSGRIEAEIERRGWSDRADYRSFATNLGSAGNLAKRLEISAQSGFDWAYTINHDGVVDGRIVGRLAAFAKGRERLGAVYPLRRFTDRAGAYDLTGLHRLPVPAVTSSEAPTGPTRVYWGSSNGALYALAPIREGVEVWSDFWMGWEDLALGWSLEAAGYAQYLVPEAVLDDNYEYKTRSAGGLRVATTAKPSWYTYYFSRNLILAARRTHQPLPSGLMVGGRIALELALIAALRPQKVERARLLVQGVLDGVRGVSGKGPRP